MTKILENFCRIIENEKVPISYFNMDDDRYVVIRYMSELISFLSANQDIFNKEEYPDITNFIEKFIIDNNLTITSVYAGYMYEHDGIFYNGEYFKEIHDYGFKFDFSQHDFCGLYIKMTKKQLVNFKIKLPPI